MSIIGIVVGVCCFISAFLVLVVQVLLQIDGYIYVYAQALCFIGALGAFFARENVGFTLNLLLLAFIAAIWFTFDFVWLI
ncbi:hypothetical protein [Caryophanon tenue]|uniref:Uncharacterized protein n=1 Tax=Caryophanon tenue TaxID=33978 RepID=A0A1C0Y703_9BACL|nr:hypothetical protein [Caryophanon tenue]OCS82969.1 hypothetical protein A6M13_06090 [Caryophanon tenue]